MYINKYSFNKSSEYEGQFNAFCKNYGLTDAQIAEIRRYIRDMAPILILTDLSNASVISGFMSDNQYYNRHRSDTCRQNSKGSSDRAYFEERLFGNLYSGEYQVDAPVYGIMNLANCFSKEYYYNFDLGIYGESSLYVSSKQNWRATLANADSKVAKEVGNPAHPLHVLMSQGNKTALIELIRGFFETELDQWRNGLREPIVGKYDTLEVQIHGSLNFSPDEIGQIVPESAFSNKDFLHGRSVEMYKL